ncbi:MAG: DUF2092 domain-containing protein [Sulfurimonadaceae bacterium]
MKLYKKLLCATGVAFLLGGTSLFAAEQSPRDILDKAFQYIGSMDRYAFHAVVVDNEVEGEETVKQYRHDVSVKVDRPGNLRVDTKGDIKNRTNTFNNGLFTMMDNGFGYYGQLKTPETINGALDFIFEKYGIKAPLASLMYSDMHKRVKVKKSKYFGTMNVDGVECDYIAFKSKVREVHVWVATGDTPLVKAYSIIDTSGEPHSRINTSLTWNTNPKISDSDFIFKAPKGAVKISVHSAN